MLSSLFQEGLANICLVGSSCTLQRAKIETNMPRKRGAAAAGYDKSLESFFRKVGKCLFPSLLTKHDTRSYCCLSSAVPYQSDTVLAVSC